MTTLEDILQDLAYGEFSQLRIGRFLPDDPSHESDPAAYAQCISHINLGLKSIYSHFLLATGRLLITQDAAVSVYVLSSDNTVSNGGALQYITDTAEIPFADDILKIEQIRDDEDNILHLDNTSEDMSIISETYRSFRLPAIDADGNDPVDWGVLSVRYRATHGQIVYADPMVPSAVEIKIPPQLHEALLWFVASRGFAALNSDQGSEGNDYYRKYQARIGEVLNQGLYIQSETENPHFADNG